MSQHLGDLNDGLEEAGLNPGSIRDRLPGKLSSDERRAVVCAIRNPDASASEIAETSGTSAGDLHDGLAVLAEDRYPVSSTDGGVKEALCDVVVNEELPPDDLLDDADRLERIASTVGRLADRAVNPDYVENLLRRDDVTTWLDATRIDRAVTDRKETAHGLSELLNDIGVRRLLAALGERPPDENLDRIMNPKAYETTEEIGITTDYVIAKDDWEPDDIQPQVPYWAKVNNKEPYGIFVTLAGSGYDDISGLVHKHHIPALLSVDDFRRGDEVMVRLIRRQANGDMGFELAGVIDALNVDTQEFGSRAEFRDLGDAAGVDEDELIEAAQDADAGEEPPSDATTEERTDDGHFPVTKDTAKHRVLQAIVENEVTAPDDALTVTELRSMLAGYVNRSTVASAASKLYHDGVLERVDVRASDRGGDAKYALYLPEERLQKATDLGKPTDWEQMGTMAEAPEADTEAPTESFSCPCGREFDTERALGGHGRWCDQYREAHGMDPLATNGDEPDEDSTTMTDATETETAEQPNIDTDFAGDVQMMAGMAIGRGDLSADEAAASLRQVAERLERGGPTTWM